LSKERALEQQEKGSKESRHGESRCTLMRGLKGLKGLRGLKGLKGLMRTHKINKPRIGWRTDLQVCATGSEKR
jgi:hypothetical protein